MNLTPNKLAEISSEYFKDIFNSQIYNVEYEPKLLLRFTGIVENQQISHSFEINEWQKKADENFLYHSLENLKGRFVAILQQQKAAK